MLQSLLKKTKEAEIHLSMFIVEHNITIRTVDYLVLLIKIIDEDSDVIKNIKCNRTKATAVVCNVIGECGIQNFIQRKKNQMFSIMSRPTNLVLNIWPDMKSSYVTAMTAQSIFESVIHFFKSYDIP